MILIQISLTIILTLYWLSIPAVLLHSFTWEVTMKDPTPFKTFVGATNWFTVFWWALIGLMLTGGLIELWKV